MVTHASDNEPCASSSQHSLATESACSLETISAAGSLDEEVLRLNNQLKESLQEVERLKKALGKERMRQSLTQKFFRIKKAPTKWNFENVKQNSKQIKFYTGLTSSQFMILWNFLGPAKNKLIHWSSLQRGNIVKADQ